MPAGFLVKLRPTGPWRIGHDSGARDRVGFLYHSDALFSAVTQAMLRLGHIEDWLAATAENAAGPAVSFSSCFPFHRDTLLVTPPNHLWPPPPSPKLRYKGARFIPLSLASGLMSGLPIEEDRWILDGPSECLLPIGKGPGFGPFRAALRSRAAVDRLEPGRIDAHSTACLEFAEGAGLWFAAAFFDEAARDRWAAPVRAALRLLADSGFGGERSLGWGHCEMPEIINGQFPALVLSTPPAAEATESAYWLLSLFAPSASDSVDWTRGSYSLLARSGRFESSSQWGALKPSASLVAEGSVLFASTEPRGAAHNIAPPHFPHPVFRSGFALSIPIPWRGNA